MLNTDYNQRVVIDTTQLPWLASPHPGVYRRMLERQGDEVARATSIVRYEPGARFDGHSHALGEEFLVLEGEFCDQWGRYPAGTYVRNPPGSFHQPYTDKGCTIFVKLRYMHTDETERVVVNTRQQQWLPGLVEGLAVMPLSSVGTEHTALVRWAPGTIFNPHRHWGGEEILVLDGTFSDEFGDYPAGHWLRSPHLSQHRPFSHQGCTILVKTGHLPDSTTVVKQ